MQPRRPYPGIGHAVLMSLGFLALSAVIVVPLLVIAVIVTGEPLTPRSTFIHSPWLLIPVNVAAISGILLWGHAANNVPWRVLLPFTRVPWSALGAVVITSVGLSSVLSELNNLLQIVWPVSEAWQNAMSEVLDLQSNPWGVAIALIVVAPLTEEPMFRGVILRGLLGRHRPVTAIVVSSALFGFVHLNPWQFVSATFLGMAFGWWYLRTRSLLPSLLGHALNNGIVALLGIYQPDIPGYSGEFTNTVVHQPWSFTLAGVALTGLGLWWFAHSTREGPPPEPEWEARPGHAVPPPLPAHALQYALAPLPVEPSIVRPTDDGPNNPTT